MSFDPNSYGSAFAATIPSNRRCALDAGLPVDSARDALSSLNVADAFNGLQIADREMAHCCLSAAWLANGYLDESHRISQAISTREGSFWHGVMHRREGDYSNAKYWFRRVGDHPVFEQLAELFGDWEPCDFIDLCQAAVCDAQQIDHCLDAQQAEWELLFDWCYRHAVE